MYCGVGYHIVAETDSAQVFGEITIFDMRRDWTHLLRPWVLYLFCFQIVLSFFIFGYLILLYDELSFLSNKIASLTTKKKKL